MTNEQIIQAEVERVAEKIHDLCKLWLPTLKSWVDTGERGKEVFRKDAKEILFGHGLYLRVGTGAKEGSDYNSPLAHYKYIPLEEVIHNGK